MTVCQTTELSRRITGNSPVVAILLKSPIRQKFLQTRFQKFQRFQRFQRFRRFQVLHRSNQRLQLQAGALWRCGCRLGRYAWGSAHSACGHCGRCDWGTRSLRLQNSFAPLAKPPPSANNSTKWSKCCNAGSGFKMAHGTSSNAPLALTLTDCGISLFIFVFID